MNSIGRSYHKALCRALGKGDVPDALVVAVVLAAFFALFAFAE